MASNKTLEQAIADIIIWRKGEQRAPHKPLLLLYVLAHYQQGHARLFDYGTEVRDQRHNLLEGLVRSVNSTALICRSGDTKAMAFENCETTSYVQRPAVSNRLRESCSISA